VMQPNYAQRDDRAFGVRLIATLMVASLPLAGGLLTGLYLHWTLAPYLVVLAVTVSIPIITVVMRFRNVRCPVCNLRIRVPWGNESYRRGEAMRYCCDACRIEWNTRLRPGSDV